MSRAVFWGAAALIAIALIIVLLRASSDPSPSTYDRFAGQFQRSSAAESSLPQGPSSPANAAAMSHAAPPSPQVLASNPEAQATYDAGAQPGEFVTPPSISIEH